MANENVTQAFGARCPAAEYKISRLVGGEGIECVTRLAEPKAPPNDFRLAYDARGANEGPNPV